MIYSVVPFASVVNKGKQIRPRLICPENSSWKATLRLLWTRRHTNNWCLGRSMKQKQKSPFRHWVPSGCGFSSTARYNWFVCFNDDGATSSGSVTRAEIRWQGYSRCRSRCRRRAPSPPTQLSPLGLCTCRGDGIIERGERKTGGGRGRERERE